MQTYYIESNGAKEGPYDAVTVMRWIHTKRISAQTMLSTDRGATFRPAGQIEELIGFFNRYPSFQAMPFKAKRILSLRNLLRAGWQFVQEHSAMTAYSGFLLIISVVLATVLVNIAGWMTGGAVAWGIFVLFTNLYFIFVLRLYRGQAATSDFLNKQLAPVLPHIVWVSFILAFMMLGGTLLLIIPGLIVSTLYVFTPFVMIDQSGLTIGQAMRRSRRMIMQTDRSNAMRIVILTLLYLVSLLLIVPIPVMLPLYGAALCELYENLVLEHPHPEQSI